MATYNKTDIFEFKTHRLYLPHLLDIVERMKIKHRSSGIDHMFIEVNNLDEITLETVYSEELEKWSVGRDDDPYDTVGNYRG